jgi:hypothetical protein
MEMVSLQLKFSGNIYFRYLSIKEEQLWKPKKKWLNTFMVQIILNLIFFQTVTLKNSI